MRMTVDLIQSGFNHSALMDFGSAVEQGVALPCVAPAHDLVETSLKALARSLLKAKHTVRIGNCVYILTNVRQGMPLSGQPRNHRRKPS